MAVFARSVPVLPLAQLGDAADIMIECAPAALLRELAAQAFAGGRVREQQPAILTERAPIDPGDDVQPQKDRKIGMPSRAQLRIPMVPSPKAVLSRSVVLSRAFVTQKSVQQGVLQARLR
jgi:hypothetical protein